MSAYPLRPLVLSGINPTRTRRSLHRYQGRILVPNVIPAAYPIPEDGPVGDMLKAQARHPFRPAHVHFMISAPTCETLVTHLFVADSDYLDSDVVFGVKDSLICALEMQRAGLTVRGSEVTKNVAALRYDFVLADADR